MKKGKIWGVALIVSGITLAIALLPIVSHNYWDSFWDYYWDVGKTNTILCLLAGMIPAGMGAYLLIRNRKARK